MAIVKAINQVKARPKLICEPGSSRTKQSFRDEVNINTIVAKHRRTGMIEHLNKKAPFYGDVSDMVDYKTALEKVKEAELLFDGMSADIKDKFAHDPQEMINFLNDPKNIEEAIELGMVIRRPNTDPNDPANKVKESEPPAE